MCVCVDCSPFPFPFVPRLQLCTYLLFLPSRPSRLPRHRTPKQNVLDKARKTREPVFPFLLARLRMCHPEEKVSPFLLLFVCPSSCLSRFVPLHLYVSIAHTFLHMSSLNIRKNVNRQVLQFTLSFFLRGLKF